MSGSLAMFDAVLHPLETTLYIVADHKAPNRFLGFPASAHPLNKFLPLEEITEDEFHREFNINVLGTLLATKEAVKYFGPNGGSVINMSSIASAGEANAPIYSGTKGAVDAITRGLATELGPRKIRVNAIAPGGVETEGTHSAGIIGSDFEKAMIAGTPLGRIGHPDDIARIAVFLASDDSAWLTGERLTASGGYR